MNHSRELGLKHYPHICDRCGLVPDDLRKLHVHHRDTDRTNNDLTNLQVLCKPCHHAVHKELGRPEKIWSARHAIGGKWNEPAIREDGTLRPDTYREDPGTGCRHWLMSFRKRRGYTGTPQAMTPSGLVVNVRRELWRIHYGDPIPHDVGASCGHTDCVAVEHIKDGVTRTVVTEAKIAEAQRLSGRVARAVIARRLGVDACSLSRYINEGGRGGYHQALQRFADAPIPPRPRGITDRNWEVFLVAREQKLEAAGDQLGISRQAVEQHVKRVLAKMESNA